MEPEITLDRIINFSIESCPPNWCPINKINPHSEGCCHRCCYLGDERFYKVFCKHPDLNEDMRSKIYENKILYGS